MCVCSICVMCICIFSSIICFFPSLQVFLRSLMEQQFASLHPFSSYQRRHTALSVLQLLSNVFPTSPLAQCDDQLCDSFTHSLRTSGHSADLSAPHLDKNPSADVTLSPIFDFPSEVSSNQARWLVYCLRDSYDANRALVIDLLSHLSLKTIGLQVNYSGEEQCNTHGINCC